MSAHMTSVSRWSISIAKGTKRTYKANFEMPPLLYQLSIFSKYKRFGLFHKNNEVPPFFFVM